MLLDACHHCLCAAPTHLWFVTLTLPHFQQTHVHINKEELHLKDGGGQRMSQTSTRMHTAMRCVHTQSTWRQTHTASHQQRHRCLFVCLRRSFWCVCDTTRLPSLSPRPLIPLVEMKCNGADSIRALPPWETRRIKSHQIPWSLPSIHCCLVDGRGIKL